MVKATFGIGESYAKFEVELDELLRIVDFLKGQLHRSHRKALKGLLEEVDKIYSTIVKAITPFYDIHAGDPNFEKSFAAKREVFKKQYLLDRETVGYRCNEVKKKLDNLTMTKPGRLSRVFRRSSRSSDDKTSELDKKTSELKRHVKKWFAIDKDVYIQLQILQKNLNSGLDKVDHILKNKGHDQASAELQSFLKESEQRFNRIKELRAKLENTSKEL